MPIWEAVSRSIRTKRVSNHTWSKANSTTDFQLGTQTHTLTLKRYVQSSTHRLLFDIACSLMGITNRLAAWLDILCTTELVIKYLVIWAIPVDLPFCWTKLPEFSKDVSRSTKSVIFSLRNILVKGFETLLGTRSSSNFLVSTLSKLTLYYKIKDMQCVYLFPILSIQTQPLIFILLTSHFCLPWFLVFQHESKLLSRRKGMAMISRVNCNTMTIVNFTFIEL